GSIDHGGVLLCRVGTLVDLRYTRVRRLFSSRYPQHSIIPRVTTPDNTKRASSQVKVILFLPTEKLVMQEVLLHQGEYVTPDIRALAVSLNQGVPIVKPLEQNRKFSFRC